MTWNDLAQKVHKWRGVLWLNHIFPHAIRKILFFISAVALLISVTLSLPVVNMGNEFIYGVFFVGASIWLFVFMLEAYYKSYYFAGIIDRKGKADLYTYEIADILMVGAGTDVARGIFFSELGKERIIRLGIKTQDVDMFFKSRHRPIGSHILEYTGDNVTARELAKAVIEYDAELKEFLAGYGITPQTFVGAVDWVSKTHMITLQEEAWWTRQKLSRIPGIGKSWSLGYVSELSRLGNPLSESPEYKVVTITSTSEKTVDEIESILSRTNNANVLVVGENQHNMMGLVASLGRRIEQGSAYPEIEHKRMYVLYHDRIFAEAKDTQTLESLLHKMFKEAVRSEEVIIVIRDLNGFIETARSYSVDLIEFMRPYISSPLVQIIGLVEKSVFESSMRTNHNILGLFDHVSYDEKETNDSLLQIVEQEVLTIEHDVDVRFTYAAVHVASEQIGRLFATGEQLTRVHTILSELALKAKNEKHGFVTKNDVEDLLHVKTGVPGSHVSKEEKAILLELESLLHNRVVGQDDAIRAIGDALRKKRSGIGNPNKPIGSFLFLGSTGVGKTETARTLADVFFGSESDMVRFDMTEFSGADALVRLLGDFKTGKPGLLVSKLREKPYSIILLDEFEKAHKDVHDLFLQILDEGVFSDMKGEQVNARNTIIVATSNAGSDLIWNLMAKQTPPAHMRETVIDHIIDEAIFRPELLNRFDGVIVFHPLEKSHLSQVAERMLAKLSERLRDQGYHFSYSKDLVDRLVQIGSDPKFGARPIARAISERVEGAIARHILQGKIKTGDTIHISAKDLL